jgi:RNA polymerase sigma factor (TIGR02999 family)
MSTVNDTAQISSLIDAIRAGDSNAADQLYGLLYAEFKSKAHLLLRVGPKQTLGTTELVNETWLRLHGRVMPIANRAHFCNLAARAMRQVLIDRARHRNAGKRGDGAQPLTLRAAGDMAGEEPFDVLALDQVMTALARVDERLAEISQLHLFAGLSIGEIAELLGCSERTAFRQWRTARMFLVKFIGEK